MSIYYANYSQYLGSQKCCNIRTQGPQGIVGPAGPAGIGPRGWTGLPGDSFTGPTGRGCRGPTGMQGSNISIIGGFSALGSAPTTTYYLGCFGSGSVSSSTITDIETDAVAIIPFNCTLSNLYVYLTNQDGPGIESSYTFTIRKGLADTSLALTISGTDVTGSNTINSVSFVQGDRITLSLLPSGTPVQTAIRWTCKIVSN